MISVKIESLIDNIVIFENELYFTYCPGGKNYYMAKPYNKYFYGSDSFDAVQLFLYHPDYLGFYSIYNIDKFRECCLKQHSERNDHFKYNGLSVIIEEVENDPLFKEVIVWI